MLENKSPKAANYAQTSCITQVDNSAEDQPEAAQGRGCGLNKQGLQKIKSNKAQVDASIVDEQRFILSTRDTGYRSTASAVAELVDNSVQAGASRIRIFVSQAGIGVERKLLVAVLDNGCGMDSVTLTTALRFGGSSRFDDRSGPGRFGMGLPNSSFSQAQRLEVYTWQKQGRVLHSYLDVGEIAAGQLRRIPTPKASPLPAWAVKYARSHTGTLVVWDDCDRLDYRKANTIAAKLHASLGRRFRHFLWDGVKISVNGEPVTAIDPMCLRPLSDPPLALPFGETLEYEVRVPSDPSKVSKIRVHFSELQVTRLHELTVEEKRSLGISKGAGISVVRSKREIDYGWFFMGGKRKENYDDWWRCEIQFDPPLDEYFGVTNSKQQITPKEELLAILTPNLEAAAHTLNSRVRAAFTMVRSLGDQRSTPATAIATANERLLRPITLNDSHQTPPPDGQPAASKPNGVKCIADERGELRYEIDTAALRTPDFYTWETKGDGKVRVTINTKHPFYEEVYQRSDDNDKVRFAFECMVLASVRADMTASTEAETNWSKRRLVSWSNALAAYLEQ